MELSIAIYSAYIHTWLTSFLIAAHRVDLQTFHIEAPTLPMRSYYQMHVNSHTQIRAPDGIFPDE